jgi:amidase
MASADLCMQPLVDVAASIRRGTLSPYELTRAVLARIEQLDPMLRSYLTLLADRALAAAERAEREIAAGHYRGPLHGVPVAVKDLCDLRGTVTTCASTVFNDRRAETDATVVERLEQAGAVIVGKTNLTEFALMGYHPSRPKPRNPWGADRETGGSSSGSGAAVAGGLCFAALGTDTGGSIRMPSAWCGVVGLKPTYGRVSRAGVFPLAASLDHIGPMTRTVADAACVLDAIAGPDRRDPTTMPAPPPRAADALASGAAGLRIGWDEQYVAAGAQPAVTAAVHAAVRVLEQAGATVVPVSLPPVDELLEGWSVLCGGDALAAHAATYPARAAAYGPSFRSFLEYASALSAADYARVHERRLNWQGTLRVVFDDIDALACPSSFMVAPPADALDPYAPFNPDFAPFGRFTFPFNFSGSPTLSVPCGFSREGLPHSLQLVGRQGEEALLCRLGHAYQLATDWHTRRPPI